MNTRKITIALLLAAIAILVGWDVYVAANATDGDTISEITLAFAMRHPVVPFGLGVIFGHLLWPQKFEEPKP